MTSASFAALLLATVATAGAPAPAASGPVHPDVMSNPPKLILMLVIDQLRADTLTRLQDRFLPARVDGKPGGFRCLMQDGAWFPHAQYDVAHALTAPGRRQTWIICSIRSGPVPHSLRNTSVVTPLPVIRFFVALICTPAMRSLTIRPSAVAELASFFAPLNIAVSCRVNDGAGRSGKNRQPTGS